MQNSIVGDSQRRDYEHASRLAARPLTPATRDLQVQLLRRRGRLSETVATILAGHVFGEVRA